jgi:tRNA(Ile2) C34 agmatinyltransferase TiaS
VIYSAEAKARAAAGRCPRCGGKLNLAGRGVIQCGHCGSEVFT